MAGRGTSSLKKRLFQFSWGKVVIVLVLLLASLQVLHMMLLSRLEEKNVHLRKERVMKSLHKDMHVLYAAMKESLENTHIVDASGLYKVIKSFYSTEKSSMETNGANSHTYTKHRTKVHSTVTSSVRTGVTLISQCSVNHLVHLAALSERWKGPISVAVFAVDGQSIEAAIDYLLRLYQCVPSVRQNVSVHLVYPLVLTVHSLPEFWQENSHTMQCDNMVSAPSQKLVQSRNYAFTRNTKYPNNLLRNVATSNAETEYIFVIDIDMLPSSNLNGDFTDFAKQTRISDERTMFVVPAFELQNGLSVPNNKKSLLQLWKRREVRPFYYEMCWRCQKPTDYDAWRNLSYSASLSVGYEVEWKDPWEPFYIGPKSIPRYDERFKQYGFNRISQVSK